MEGCFMLMCKYSNCCAAIKISEGCSYDEVVEKICAKFKELSVGGSGCHVVDVVVGDKRIVEVDDGNSSRIDSVIGESSLVNDCDDFGGLLPNFYPEPERKLRRIAGNGRVDSMLDGLQNDKGKRYGEMSSNAVESYNNWIGGARELPITCMVDMIRVQIMTQLSNRRAESKRWTTKLCPVMEKKLVDSLELAKSWDVIVGSDIVLEVHSSISFYVDIGRQTCSCHEWQLNGFPCCHAVHALRSSDCFRESYKESVYPVPSSERFDFDGASSSIIKPPITKKQPGRNKKKRIPSRGENVKQIKCGRCLKYGNHNKKTCKAAI
ncbi:hypothetical protein ACSBR1_042455 [Camellia fascicularis]